MNTVTVQLKIKINTKDFPKEKNPNKIAKQMIKDLIIDNIEFKNLFEFKIFERNDS